LHNLKAPADEQGIGRKENGVCAVANKGRESRIDLAAGARLHDLDLQTNRARSGFHVSQCGFRLCVGRIHKYRHANGCRHQLTQECKPLSHQFVKKIIDTCHVAARPGEAGNKTKPYWVVANIENNGDRRGCRFGRQRRMDTSGRDDRGDLTANQFIREGRQSIKLIPGPTVFDGNVLALDIAALFETQTECAKQVRVRVERCAVEKSNHRHRRLLRARRERPRRRPAEQRDERAPLHSITSSASNWIALGTSRSSALAVCMLMTNSNLLDCMTGRSAGFVPLRI